MNYTRILTIAGSDSGGGAGIQADLKTFAAHHCYGLSVITALTAQNTIGVTAIHDVPPAFVAEQLDAVLTDIGVDAVKIGMLSTPAVIETVAEKLRQYEVNNIVLDPVMVATSGDRLLRDDAIDVLRNTLLPLATIITPNIPEAEVLLNRAIQSPAELQQAARDLLQLGAASALVKGGHFDDEHSDDALAHPGGFIWIRGTRIATKNTHGTGCTLSSAIAAGLGLGLELVEAVEQAKRYITGAIEAGAHYSLGQGCGPVCHHYRTMA
jgi:hydroxymethylpyrimidine kinase/phosphomethylpyrimidine kinase